jgi:hypothetical protein
MLVEKLRFSVLYPDSTYLTVYDSTALCWALEGGSAGRKAAICTQDSTHKHNTQTSIPRVGFEPPIPAFERVKTVHALDRTATLIAQFYMYFV